MSNENKLMGFTFHELHGAMTNAELTAAMIMFTVNMLRENPDLQKAIDDRMDDFLRFTKEECEAMLADQDMTAMWEHMREVYDSEKKFNSAVDMMAKMSNMSVVINRATMKVIDRMQATEVQ